MKLRIPPAPLRAVASLPTERDAVTERSFSRFPSFLLFLVTLVGSNAVGAGEFDDAWRGWG
jgi:hypothetical protein